VSNIAQNQSRVRALMALVLGVPQDGYPQPDSREIKGLIMASDLPEDGLGPSQNNTEASVFPNDDGNRLSQAAIWPQGLPTLAPWSNLSWGLFLPLVFAGNVVLATLAWIIVGIVMR
jgi:hypothetical protein